MKTLKYILLTAIAIPTLTFGQGLNETFDDGDLTNAPTWTGETTKFEVSKGQLHLNDASATSPAYLAMPTMITLPDTAEWRVDVKFTENPSSSNFGEVFLMSDISDLNGSVNGYKVKIGGTPDDVSLIRLDGGAETIIINGTDKTVESSPDVSIKLTRIGNVFELFLDANKSGTFVSEGTANDATYNTNSFAGVKCTYSSTRNDAWYFDNFFIGTKYVAPPAPPAPEKKSGEIVVNPKIFAPSPLSENILLQEVKLGYTIDTTGLQTVVGNLFIFNSRGQMVRHLAQNLDVFDEPVADLIWDGKNDNDQPVEVGIYTIVMEYIDNKGNSDRFKAAVAVGSNLN